MSEEQCKYYRFGYSGCNYLCINRSVYTQSELLPNGIIREIQCDKDDKWMKVRERKKEKKKESFPQFFLALCVIRYVSFVKKDKKSNESLSFSDGSNLKVHMT